MNPGPNKKGKNLKIILIFEGEFLNEQKWKGKIRIYSEDEKLKFIGELLNG